MASNASALLKLEEMGTGEQDGQWGTRTTNNLNRLEEAISGEEALAFTSVDITLTDTQYAINQARKMVLSCTGTLTDNVAIIVPARTKVFIVKNGTAGAFSLTIKVSGQTGVVVPQGGTTIVYCNGTDVENVVSDKLSSPLDTNSHSILESKGADVASAAGLAFLTDGNFVDITGNVTVTSMATIGGKGFMTCQFDGILRLTHHDTNLILPTAANIDTAAGDVAGFFEYGAGTWVCLYFTRASGAALVGLLPTGVGSALTGIDIQGSKHLFIPAAAMIPTTTAGCSVLTKIETTAGSPDLQVLDFAADDDDHAQFQMAMPDSWDKGTITAQFFWTVSAAVSTGLTWGIQAIAMGDNVSIDTAWSAPQVIDDDAQGATQEILVSDFTPAMTVQGTPLDDNMIFFRVFRDVSATNDDMTQGGRLIGVRLAYTTDAGNDA